MEPFVLKQVDHGTSVEAQTSEGTFAIDDFVVVSYDGELCPGHVLDLDEGVFYRSAHGQKWQILEMTGVSGWDLGYQEGSAEESCTPWRDWDVSDFFQLI